MRTVREVGEETGLEGRVVAKTGDITWRLNVIRIQGRIPHEKRF